MKNQSEELLEQLNSLIISYEEGTEDVKEQVIQALVSQANEILISEGEEQAALFYAEAAKRGHLQSMINAGVCLSGDESAYYLEMAKERYDDFDEEGQSIIDYYLKNDL